MEVLTLTIFCREGHPPADDIFVMTAARSQYLLDLLAQVPDPRKRRGRRHALAALLAVGIAAVIAGSRSFAAIGQWAADAGPEVLAGLGAARGPAEESTFRRAFALVSPDVLDRGSRRLAAHPGGAGRRPAGDRHRRQDPPRRQGQERKGPAPGRGAGPRHRSGPRPGRRRGEVQRDPRGAGAAEGVRQPRRRGHYDRRNAHAKRHRAGHPQPRRGLRDDRRACFTLLLLSVMACQRVQPGRIRPGYAGLCGVPG